MLNSNSEIPLSLSNRRGIGIDFDNTIASYDELMHQTAVEWGLLDPGHRPGKKSVRDQLRRLPGGENHWRRLQTYAYGEGMKLARPMEGVKKFLRYCRLNGIPVWIVSHKTEYNNYGPPTVNLHQAAQCWLENQGFFDELLTGLNIGRVYFEATMADKVNRIASLGIGSFIDDLEEVFREPTFPATVDKIHYVPHGEKSSIANAFSAKSWADILDHISSLNNAS